MGRKPKDWGEKGIGEIKGGNKIGEGAGAKLELRAPASKEAFNSTNGGI